MKIQIITRNMEISEELSQHIMEKFKKLEHHFHNITYTQIFLKIDKLVQVAEGSVHMPGHEIHAQAESMDNWYTALDELLDKLSKQVIKYKEKLTEHH